MKLLGLLLIIAAAAPAAITVKHAAGGADTSYAEDRLQNAIDDPLTVCGDIIEIDPGASRHNTTKYRLRGPALSPALGGPAVAPSYAKDCAPSGKYITLRSSRAYQLTPGKRAGAADAAYLAFIGLLPDLTPSDGCTVFETERGASYWRLQGLNISATNGDCVNGGNAIVKIAYTMDYDGSSGMTSMDSFPHHITIDQCWIHGIDSYQVRDGIELEGILVNLINSTVENIRTTSGTESHGITSVSGRGPLRIVNDKLSGGQSSVFFGGFPSPTKRPAEYVEFSNNWVYRPYKWMDWSGTTDPTPLSPCPVDSDGHGATYSNTTAGRYWECQGALPGTWTQLANVAAYNALVAIRLPYFGKNLTEFKNATMWHIEGNLLEQGVQLALVGQPGICFSWNSFDGPASKISHMTAENNLCQHSGWAFRQGQQIGSGYPYNPDNETRYWDNGGRQIHDLLLRNNLFAHMGEDMTTNPAFGALDGGGNRANFEQDIGFANLGHPWAERITIDHQTFQSEFTGGNAQHNIGLRGDADAQPAYPALSYRVTNNIFTAGLAPIVSSRGAGYNGNSVVETWGPGAEMANNGIVDNLLVQGASPFAFDGSRYHCAPGFLACPYTADYFTYPPNNLGPTTDASALIRTPTLALFTNYPNDLTLQSSSPYKAAALDGKDLGADLNMVGWATAGAQAGTMAPYLTMKIRAVIPAANSVQVRFSAPDTSSCTIAARVYGFPLSSPAATATDNTGTLGRLVTLTGLTGNTKYGLKVTCAGTYYREDEFRTP